MRNTEHCPCPTCKSPAGHRSWCSTEQAMRAAGPVPVAAPPQQPRRPALEAFSRAIHARLGAIAAPNVTGVLEALKRAERMLPDVEMELADLGESDDFDDCVCALWDRALMTARVATRTGRYAEAQELIDLADRLNITDLQLQLEQAQQRLNEARGKRYRVRYYDAKLSRLGKGVQYRSFSDRSEAEAFAAANQIYSGNCTVEEVA